MRWADDRRHPGRSSTGIVYNIGSDGTLLRGGGKLTIHHQIKAVFGHHSYVSLIPFELGPTCCATSTKNPIAQPERPSPYV